MCIQIQCKETPGYKLYKTLKYEINDNKKFIVFKCNLSTWRRGVVVMTTAQLQSTKAELGLCARSNPACGVLEICDGDDL